jgi:hypothetical protein
MQPETASAINTGGPLHEPANTVVVACLLGRALGFVLLGIALLQARTVPAWAAVAVVLFPFVPSSRNGL